VKIDMNYKFKNLLNKVIREKLMDEDEETGNPRRDEWGNILFKMGGPFTLRKICVDVLIASPPELDDRTGRPRVLSSDKKIKRYELLRRIHDTDGLVELSAEEITLLKSLINRKHENPLYVGQAFDILDPMESAGKGEDEEPKVN